MAQTISNQTGDGVTSPFLQTNIFLPDTNGGNISVQGTVTPLGGSAVVLTGSPFAYPVAPATGSIYLLIEANTTTGACTLLQSTSAMPTVDPGNVLIFQDTLTPTTTDLAQDPNAVTPDTY